MTRAAGCAHLFTKASRVGATCRVQHDLRALGNAPVPSSTAHSSSTVDSAQARANCHLALSQIPGHRGERHTVQRLIGALMRSNTGERDACQPHGWFVSLVRASQPLAVTQARERLCTYEVLIVADHQHAALEHSQSLHISRMPNNASRRGRHVYRSQKAWQLQQNRLQGQVICCCRIFHLSAAETGREGGKAMATGAP